MLLTFLKEKKAKVWWHWVCLRCKEKKIDMAYQHKCYYVRSFEKKNYGKDKITSVTFYHWENLIICFFFCNLLNLSSRLQNCKSWTMGNTIAFETLYSHFCIWDYWKSFFTNVFTAVCIKHLESIEFWIFLHTKSLFFPIECRHFVYKLHFNVTLNCRL